MLLSSERASGTVKTCGAPKFSDPEPSAPLSSATAGPQPAHPQRVQHTMGLVSDRIEQFRKTAAVNSQMTWGDVGALLVQGRPVRNAFLDARMVLLPARTRLYKLNSYPGLQANAEGNVTGWWHSFNAYDVDPGWYAKVAMARNLNVSLRELGRVTSAITESWNSCEWAVMIELKVDIWAAYGRFRQQARVDGFPSKRITAAPGSGTVNEGKLNTRNLPGGGRQFYVPNLKPAYFTQVGQQSLLNM
jgi:hypothetical protein